MISNLFKFRGKLSGQHRMFASCSRLYYIILCHLLILLLTCSPFPSADIPQGTPVDIPEIAPGSYVDYNGGGYSGAAGSDYRILRDMTWSRLEERKRELEKEGWQLVDVETAYSTTFLIWGDRTYAGVWYLTDAQTIIQRFNNWSSFRSQWERYIDEGTELIDIEVYDEFLGDISYIGIWQRQGVETHLLNDLSWREFQDKVDEYYNDGFGLLDVEVYNDGGARYAALWTRGRRDNRLWKTSSISDFRQRFLDFANEGYRLVDFEIILEEGRKNYFGVWEDGGSDDGLLLEQGWDEFESNETEFLNDGMLLIDLEITMAGRTTRYSGLWSR